MANVKLPDSELSTDPIPRKRSQSYDYDYFSGSITNLYIGEILIDEVTSVKYNLEQQKRPIYGYSSQNWNFMAKGIVVVTGYFTINFKESGYLYHVLDYFNDRDKDSHPILKPVTEENKNDTKINKKNIERILKGDTDVDEYEFYNNLAALPDADFENVAEIIEDQIWQGDARSIEKKRTRPDEFSEFDIYITYGNIDSPAANHTARRITGVELTGQSQVIEISGEPLQEAYTFIARDVV